jgi:hypothetical protein
MTRVSCVMATTLLAVQLTPQWNEVGLLKRVGDDVLVTKYITDVTFKSHPRHALQSHHHHSLSKATSRRL